jgi:hypothetical protein
MSLRRLETYVVAILVPVNAILYVLFLKDIQFRAPGRLSECAGIIMKIAFSNDRAGIRTIPFECIRDGFMLIASSTLLSMLAAVERALITKLMEQEVDTEEARP